MKSVESERIERSNGAANGTSSGMRALVRWFALVALWSIPAMAGTINGVLFMRAAGIHGSLWDAAAVEFPGWLMWVPLTIVIGWLGTRFPLAPFRLANAGVHVSAAALFSVLHAIVVAVSFRIETNQVPALARERDIVFELIKYLPVTVLIYGAVLAIDYAQRYQRRAAVLSQQLSAAQLGALRAQIHPHVVFNSLNAAVALVRARQCEDAEHVLIVLSDVLRTVIRADPAHEVTLGQELAFIERWLEIERIRFGPRLRVSVSAPSALREALVPNLILQPLVENAILHGVSAANGHSCVEITARGDANRLVIVVRNEGSRLRLDREGVGLRSTRARLAQHYGDRASFALSSVPSGVEARLDLPLRVNRD